VLPVLPSRRLAAIIALAGAGFLVGPGLAAVLNGAVVVLVLVEGILLYRELPPTVRRTVAGRVPLGGTAEVVVELGGNGDRASASRPRRVLWTDDTGPGLQRLGPDPIEVVVPRREVATIRYAVRGLERGPSALEDAHMRILGPLGLLWRRHRVVLLDPLAVQPGLLELRRHRLMALHHRREIGTHRLRQVGEGREFARLREYVRGDDPRRMDWKATARRGKPIMREYEAERSQSLVLAVDAGRLMSERFGGRERLDHALAAALVLADAAAVNGDSIGVLVFADRVQHFLPPSHVPLSRIADALAAARPRRVEPDYPRAFRYLGSRLRRRSLVVLFSDVVDSHTSRALLAHLSASARRHLPLLVAIRNVELEEAARAPAAREEDAYRRAAAEELLQEREVALTAVRRQGVLVSDVSPEEVVTGTVARYLEVKRRGLL
jgi:uncharacterized protein (DUF58 family)